MPKFEKAIDHEKIVEEIRAQEEDLNFDDVTDLFGKVN